MKPSRILYPVELTADTHHGLATAGGLARRFDAELLLAHAIDFPYPYLNQISVSFDLEAYYRETEKAFGDRLEALAATVAPGVRTRALLLRGDPAGAIVQAIEDEDADLVVMPTHARTGFVRLLVGSVTEKVVRLSPAPVLIVPPSEERTGELAPRKILVPTDFSDRSDRALEPALELAASFDADVLMLHVVTIGEADPANPDWGFPAIPEQHVEEAVKAAREQLESRTGGVASGVRVATRLVRGFDAAEEIVRVAQEEDADLVVMATHGHTGLMRVLLGSTTAKVIRHLQRPLLTIKTS